MDINRKFVISNRVQNRYFILGDEIEKKLNIPRFQTMGLSRLKGIENVDSIYRQIQKSETAKNKAAVFLSEVAKLPTIYRPIRQLKLKLKKSRIKK